MIPIYCITLLEEPGKFEAVRKRLSDLPVTYLAGVHGITIGLKPTNPYSYDEHGISLYLHPSQIGCALSHRFALMYGLAVGAPEFIICEDDIDFFDDFRESFPLFRKSLPQDAEVAQLEWAPDKRPVCQVNDRVAKVQYPFRAGCIWWTRPAAIKALALMRPIDSPYDILLMQKVFPFLNHYVASPQLAAQLTANDLWPSSVGDAPEIDNRHLG